MKTNLRDDVLGERKESCWGFWGGGRGRELGGKCNRYLGILQKLALALAQPRLLVIMIATKVCCVCSATRHVVLQTKGPYA